MARSIRHAAARLFLDLDAVDPERLGVGDQLLRQLGD